MSQPRVAYVSPIAQNAESQVRQAHDRFPQEVLADVGAREISVFIGNGYYVMVFDFMDGDFQTQFARFTGHPAVREFFNGLGDLLLEPLPQSTQPADGFHEGAAPHGNMGTTTARLPLVGEVLHWDAAH